MTITTTSDEPEGVKTPLSRQVGIEFPIFAFSHCRDVVIAVSKAGGIGVLGAVELSPDELDQDLSIIEEALGPLPYGVDLVIPSKYVGKDEDDFDLATLQGYIPAEHRTFVAELLEQHSVPPLPPDIEPASGMVSWSSSGAAPLLDVALEHHPRLLANALGSPPPEFVSRAHDHDILVAALAGTRKHALRHREVGVDIIVAQGYEAGGHTGEISTSVLVTDVVDAVAPTPVLAAGGIARGKQIAAMMALGAQGVWTGSVWLTTREAETHPVVKEIFLAAGTSDTVRSRGLTGKPARQVVTGWTQAWDAPESPGTLPMPLQTILIAEARQRIIRAVDTGNLPAQTLMTGVIGQAVGLLNEVKPAGQVVMEMVEEYIETVTRLAKDLLDEESS